MSEKQWKSEASGHRKALRELGEGPEHLEERVVAGQEQGGERAGD